MKRLNKVVGEAVLISPLFILSVFLGLWTECALIIGLLFIYKAVYPYQYHSDKNGTCVLISYITVALGILLAYVFNREYFLLILADNAIAYTSARIGNMQRTAKKYELIAEPYAELVQFYEAYIAPRPFNTDTATETELLDRCRELHFSEENTELAVEFFVKKTKQSTLADRLCVEEDTIRKRKMRMKKILNNR